MNRSLSKYHDRGMQITVLKSKIHHARVTGVDASYEGSIVVDTDLMEEVGLHQYEKVLVSNLDNGNRFETYAIAGEPGSRAVMLNGAAAHLGQVGDRVIIFAFSQIPEPELQSFTPKIIQLDEKNHVVHRSFAK